MSQAAASIHVVTTHAATAARAATKADASAPSAPEGVDFSALLAGQLGTSAEGLKAIADPALAQEDQASQPDLADTDVLDPNAQADALAALGIPAIHPNAQAASTDPVKGARTPKMDLEASDANADAAAMTPVPVAALAETKRALPAELAASTEVGSTHADALPVGKAAEPAAAPIAAPPGTPAQSQTTQAAQGVDPTDRPIAMGRAGFADEVGNRLTWMAAHGKHEAEIRIDPPHLGPLELRLSITGDQASLSVVSAHASVRDAVQNSVSRLQDMMQAVGVNLGQVFVGQGSQDQQPRNEFSGRSGRSGSGADDDQDSAIPPLTQSTGTIRRGSGLVDVFA